MGTYAAPVLYAVLLWWFSTGLILLLDHAPRRTHPWSMAGATLLLAGALVAIRSSAADTSATGAYTAFTAALVVWGWQEMSYYMGFLSGPRPVACAPSVRGLDRFLAALATSLWHEFAIVVGGLAILALVWGSPNRFALWTYGTLVVMNLSARLNLFLGVRNLHAEFLPDHLGYLACYLSRKPMNLLFPVSVSLGHSRANLNRTPDEQVAEVGRVVAWLRTQPRKVPVEVGCSTAFGCSIDGKVPERIAYISCTGSRDKQVGNPLCSKVCCMYSIKQNQLIMGALPLADVTMHYMDMRAAGKELFNAVARHESVVPVKVSDKKDPNQRVVHRLSREGSSEAERINRGGFGSKPL